jgi:hypothetical protein
MSRPAVLGARRPFDPVTAKTAPCPKCGAAKGRPCRTTQRSQRRTYRNDLSTPGRYLTPFPPGMPKPTPHKERHAAARELAAQLAAQLAAARRWQVPAEDRDLWQCGQNDTSP